MDKSTRLILNGIIDSVELPLPIQVTEAAFRLRDSFNARMEAEGLAGEYKFFVAPPFESSRLANVNCYIDKPDHTKRYADEIDNIVQLYGGREDTLDLLVLMYRIGKDDENELPMKFRYTDDYPPSPENMVDSIRYGITVRNMALFDEEVIAFLLHSTLPNQENEHGHPPDVG